MSSLARLSLLVLGGLFAVTAMLQAQTPSEEIICRKATPPIDVNLVVLVGGHPGERTTLALVATPHASGGQLDLDLILPEGLPVISGVSSTSEAGNGSPRLVQVDVEVPVSGSFHLLGRARWRLPGGQVWSRGDILDLPLGVARAPAPSLPLRALPGGGFRVEFVGEARP
jgi:hypothetical protein